MNIKDIAKELGRRGGKARAKKLSPARRKEIASKGGRSKSFSRKAIQRIEDNFRYLEIIHGLRKPPKVKRVSRVNHPLPDLMRKNDLSKPSIA
jgi:general stress protein YciG